MQNIDVMDANLSAAERSAAKEEQVINVASKLMEKLTPQERAFMLLLPDVISESRAAERAEILGGKSA